MRSVPAWRLLGVLLLAIAAVIVFSYWPGEAARSASDAPTSVRTAPLVEATAARQQSASGAKVPPVPGDNASGGPTADPADQFAAAMAAAERNGSINKSAAQAASAQEALEMLDKLMREQARKEPLPLVSPFGDTRPGERAR